MKTDNMKGGGTAVVRIPKELDDWLTDIAEQTVRSKPEMLYAKPYPKRKDILDHETPS